MGGPIDMEWNGCESIGCQIHYVTLNFNLTQDLNMLNLGFSQSNLKKKKHISGMGRLIDMKRKRWESQDVGPTMWPRTLTLTLDFHGQILEELYLRNGWTDWHATKGMRVNRMLDPLCNLELRDSKLFTSLWVPPTHGPWSLWVPLHRKGVTWLMFLIIRNISMHPQDAHS